MSEFDLIQRYFTHATPSALLGVGDDAALLQIQPGNVLAVSSDMLVSGTHFFADADPYLLGHKTLAVNLSDLAAMGATPRWATLAIALPSVDEAWLAQFSAGFFALAEQHGVALVGGDTTRGSLNLCVTILGEVPAQHALRRDAAQVDDDIWVSGTLGAAALGLAYLQGKLTLNDAVAAHCLTALHQPHPRVACGIALRGVAHSAIDLSDGLLADLGHILELSEVGAQLDYAAMPVAPMIAALEIESTLLQRCVLAGGDDYELCFTAPVAQRAVIVKLAETLAVPLSRIGKVIRERVCKVIARDGSVMTIEKGGYDHFA